MSRSTIPFGELPSQDDFFARERRAFPPIAARHQIIAPGPALFVPSLMTASLGPVVALEPSRENGTFKNIRFCYLNLEWRATRDRANLLRQDTFIFVLVNLAGWQADCFSLAGSRIPWNRFLKSAA